MTQDLSTDPNLPILFEGFEGGPSGNEIPEAFGVLQMWPVRQSNQEHRLHGRA
jgi:hypothetical protein